MLNDSFVVKILNQQRALAEFGAFAFRESDLRVILDETARICARELGASHCKICRYRPESNDLLIEAGVGWSPAVIGSAVSRADLTSPAGRAFVTRGPVVSSDLSDFELPVFYGSIVSTVNVVIHSRSETPYGILEIDDEVIRSYDHQDISFLTGFANVLAEAVATARRVTRLRVALAEREVLSRELQHRVRNNLHLIHAMLTVESEYYPDAEQGFQSIANRVQALAVVYDHLLGIGLSHDIAFSAYLEKLCVSLSRFQPGDIQLIRHPLCAVMLDLETATALGIAVTELITNSYKHAFGGGPGKIEISLACVNERVTLVIQDDGVGVRSETVSRRHGFGLVRRLIQQINGTVTIVATHPGTRCELNFPLQAGATRLEMAGLPFPYA